MTSPSSLSPTVKAAAVSGVEVAALPAAFDEAEDFVVRFDMKLHARRCAAVARLIGCDVLDRFGIGGFSLRNSLSYSRSISTAARSMISYRRVSVPALSPKAQAQRGLQGFPWRA